MLTCPLCDRPMVTICDEDRCGICYEREMLAEPIKSIKNHPGEFKLVRVYDETKHMFISKREQ